MSDVSHVKGLFKLIDTYGYPLEYVLWELKEDGLFPDWKDFIADAIDANWTYEQIFKKVWYTACEAYGEGFERLKWAIPATYLLVLNEKHGNIA